MENKSKDEKKPEAIDLDKEGEKKKKVVKVEQNDDDDDDFEIEGGDVEIIEDEKNNYSDNAVMVKARKYDVTITYDPYYEVPRMWLMGYENGIPLNDGQMREDVMPEYYSGTRP